MALTDQPYFPFYPKDWMTNEKLNMCSLASHGLMINIMSMMHKSETYGKILLKQKFKQTLKQNVKHPLKFCLQLTRLFAFEYEEMTAPFLELLEEKVIRIEGDYLVCDRMVSDAEISLKRSKSGKKGGLSTHGKGKKFAKANAKAKKQANTAYGYVIVSGDENGNNNKGVNSKIPLETMPFGELFRQAWLGLLQYRKDQHEFEYKTGATEMIALKDLLEKCDGQEKNAMKIIQQSIANGWKGFYELNTTKNSKNRKSSMSDFSKSDIEEIIKPRQKV